MKRLATALAAIVLLAGIPGSTASMAEQRTWTDVTGRFTVEAEFVGLQEGQVSLRKGGGEVVKLPIERLSSADRRWVIRHRRLARAAEAPVASTTGTETADWPRWRGPAGDGISPESGLLKSWSDAPPVVWSSRGLGSGYSSLAIHDAKIYTMGKKGSDTKLMCVSIQDGSPIWETIVSSSGGAPNCTPTVDPEGGLVYGISHDGKLLCAQAGSGKQVWKIDFGTDLGGAMMSGWGYSESPLVDGDRLICTPGSDLGVMVALDKRSGDVIWKTPMDDGKSGYASAVISHAGGVKQYVTLVGRGLIGVRARDGQLLWHYPRIANNTANIPTPIVRGDFVFGSSGYGDGGSALLRITSVGRDQVRADEVYYKRNNEVQNHHGGMVLIGEHIYMGHGHNNGLPLCLHMPTGRVMWGPLRGPGTGSAAVLAADGHLYFRYENAVMGLMEVTPVGYKLKGSFKIKSKNGKSWSHPVIADKKLYLRDQDELHCYNIAE